MTRNEKINKFIPRFPYLYNKFQNLISHYFSPKKEGDSCASDHVLTTRKKKYATTSLGGIYYFH